MWYKTRTKYPTFVFLVKGTANVINLCERWRYETYPNQETLCIGFSN